MTIEWSLPAAHDALADAVPDHDMLVWNDVRRIVRRGPGPQPTGWPASWSSTGSACTASARSSSGGSAGSRRSPLVMHNRPEYIEAMLGAYRARAVPVQREPALRRRPRSARCSTMVGAGRGRLPAVVRAARRRGDRDTTTPRAGRHRRRLGSRAAPGGQRRVRGGHRSRSRDRAPGAERRRPLPGVHRRHHRPTQRRAVAPGRHLRVGHGRHRADDGRVAGRRRDGRTGGHGSRSPR